MANIAKGVGISIGFTLIFLLIFSIILTYTNISEEWISPVIIVLTGISILIGSSIGNISLKKNGILNGGIIGGIYFFIAALTQFFDGLYANKMSFFQNGHPVTQFLYLTQHMGGKKHFYYFLFYVW